MAKDWVKVTAISLAIIFFFMWILGTSLNNSDYELLTEKYNILYDHCNNTIQNSNSDVNDTVTILTSAYQAQLQNLQNQWQLSFNTLLNCYTYGTPECPYTTPTLNLSK
jgi:hypothetical protein